MKSKTSAETMRKVCKKAGLPMRYVIKTLHPATGPRAKPKPITKASAELKIRLNIINSCLFPQGAKKAADALAKKNGGRVVAYWEVGRNTRMPGHPDNKLVIDKFIVGHAPNGIGWLGFEGWLVIDKEQYLFIEMASRILGLNNIPVNIEGYVSHG